MVKFFVHGQRPSASIDHPFHFHQSELIKSVCPQVHCMFVLYYNVCQSLVEGSCRHHMLNILIVFNDIDVRTNCVFEG